MIAPSLRWSWQLRPAQALAGLLGQRWARLVREPMFAPVADAAAAGNSEALCDLLAAIEALAARGSLPEHPTTCYRGISASGPAWRVALADTPTPLVSVSVWPGPAAVMPSLVVVVIGARVTARAEQRAVTVTEARVVGAALTLAMSGVWWPDPVTELLTPAVLRSCAAADIEVRRDDAHRGDE